MGDGEAAEWVERGSGTCVSGQGQTHALGQVETRHHVRQKDS